MSRLRVGLVGFGRMGRHHARSLSNAAEVDFVGVADRDGAAPDPSFGNVPYVRDLAALLALEPQAVIVATPPSTQSDLAMGLADSDVHALIEKPLADTSSAARKVADRYAATSLVAVVGYVERCNPALADLKGRIERGDIGTLQALATQRIGPEPPSHGHVGVGVDLAPHDIDLAMWLAGGRLEISGAEALFIGDSRVERHLEAVGHVGETVISLRTGWHGRQRRRSVTAYGDEGILEADPAAGSVTAWPTRDGDRETVVHDLAAHDPLRTQLSRFCAAIRGEAPNGLVDLERAVEILEIAETTIALAAASHGGAA